MMLWTAPALRHRSAIETRRSYLRTLTIHRARAALAKLEASRVREADGLLAFACVGVESGRKLRRHAYAAKALLLPIWPRRSQYWRVSLPIFRYLTSLFFRFATTRGPKCCST
jgi:hypothetical protein